MPPHTNNNKHGITELVVIREHTYGGTVGFNVVGACTPTSLSLR